MRVRRFRDAGTTIHPSTFPSDLFADSISSGVSSLMGLGGSDCIADPPLKRWAILCRPETGLETHTPLPSTVAIATEIQFISVPIKYVYHCCPVPVVLFPAKEPRRNKWWIFPTSTIWAGSPFYVVSDTYFCPAPKYRISRRIKSETRLPVAR